MANFAGRLALHVADRDAGMGVWILATPPLALSTFALRA